MTNQPTAAQTEPLDVRSVGTPRVRLLRNAADSYDGLIRCSRCASLLMAFEELGETCNECLGHSAGSAEAS